MSTQNDTFSEVVDIILNRYNLIDSRIWSFVKRENNHRVIDVDSVLIDKNTLENIILKNFKNQINRFQSIEGAILFKEANTVYFIWKLLTETKNLTWVKINLIKNSKYSRVVDIDDVKTIKFSIKTMRGTFRVFDHFEKSQIPVVNHFLRKINIFTDSKPYKVIPLSALFSAFDANPDLYNINEFANIINVISLRLERYEVDNPEVLIVTDYKLDI